MKELIREFDQDMVNIYKTAKKECGYTASRFLQMISKEGGLAAAKQLIVKDGGTDGFATLMLCGRLDLTVEAYVLKPKYCKLFTDEERQMCKERLENYGYRINL